MLDAGEKPGGQVRGTCMRASFVYGRRLKLMNCLGKTNKLYTLYQTCFISK